MYNPAKTGKKKYNQISGKKTSKELQPISRKYKTVVFLKKTLKSPCSRNVKERVCVGGVDQNLNFGKREVHDVRPGVDAPGDPDLHVAPLRRQLADEEPRHVPLREHGVHEQRHVGAPRGLVERRHVHGAHRRVRVRHVQHRRAVPDPDAVQVLRREHQRRHRARRRRRRRPVRGAAVRRRRRQAEGPVHLDGLQVEGRLLEPRDEDGEQRGGDGEQEGEREEQVEAEASS